MSKTARAYQKLHKTVYFMDRLARDPSWLESTIVLTSISSSKMFRANSVAFSGKNLQYAKQ